MSIADGNGYSRAEDGHHDGPGELFYCPMCMEKVPIILKSGFGCCGHAFCSDCVAKYVALRCTFECPDCRDTIIPVAMFRVEDGHHDGPGELFYCPMCMEKVPITLKSSFGSCGHAFCSNCVAKYVALRCFECPDCRDTTVPVAMLRPPETPHIDLVTGDNENSQVDGKDLAGDKRFYCAKCMHVVSCACIRPSHTSCSHDFCSSCVALKLRDNVLRPRRRAGKQPLHRPETPQIDIDPHFVTGDTENSRVNGKDFGEGKPFIFFSKRNEGKLFYCAKCMHVVACACVRPSFTSCTHDFCSSCVALKLRVNVPRPTSRRRRRAGKQPLRHPSNPTDGNGDLPVPREVFDCAICMETVPNTLKFSINSCGHTFCSSCIAQYIAAKLDDKVGCIGCPHPGCKAGAIELESCQGIIPPDILDRWGFLLCELAVGAQRMYCPFRDCSALLLVDGETVAAAISEAECPHCHRLFCARCAVPWHDGFGCEEFQKLGQDERGREDLLLRRLVGREGWQRCPKCQMFVEKSEGCNYIKCRCGHSFCYRCASKLTTQNHFCNKCKR